MNYSNSKQYSNHIRFLLLISNILPIGCPSVEASGQADYKNSGHTRGFTQHNGSEPPETTDILDMPFFIMPPSLQSVQEQQRSDRENQDSVSEVSQVKI